MHAKICLAAMQKYLAEQNKSITDSFVLPTISNYDKNTLLATIIRRYSSLPTLYNDPDWFYDECALWWDENKFAFLKMWEAIETEYKPLENYNRHQEDTTTPGITSTETHSGSDSETHTGTDSTAITGTETNAKTGHDDLERQGKLISDTDTVQNSKDVTETKVSAFNESNYQNSNKVENSKEYPLDSNNQKVPDNEHNEITHENDKDVNTYNSTDTLTHNTTNTLTHGETITDQHGHIITNTQSGFDTFESDISGNIGVTTSQQMLESEIVLRQKFNLYKIMANTFADDLCLGIW